MAQLNIRIDDDLKARAEALFSELGLNMSTGVGIYLRQAVRQRGIPFEITAATDPFYSEENQKVLRESIRQADQGKLTAHELIEI
jgi:DNA-damage-inducible protein J